MTATPVAPLTPLMTSPLRSTTTCATPHCHTGPQWLVGPHVRSCDEHLAMSVRAVLAVSDGFTPPVVLPIGRAR